MSTSIVRRVTGPHTEPAVAEARGGVVVERGDGVVTITLDQPGRLNAITWQMWTDLRDTFRDIAVRSDDRVVVVTGAGDAFCSGADLGDQPVDSHHLSRMRVVGEACLALHRLPQPTIARVNGVAVGAGLNLALACDLVIASRTARLCEIFSRRGLTVDFGGSWLLPRLVGLQRAKELVLLAEMIDADRAERLGLVNRVVEPEDLDAAVGDWAERLAAGPPIALAMSKELLNAAFSVTLAQAVDDEGRAQTVNAGTGDTAEAVDAFLQKRPPVFRGR